MENNGCVFYWSGVFTRAACFFLDCLRHVVFMQPLVVPFAPYVLDVPYTLGIVICDDSRAHFLHFKNVWATSLACVDTVWLLGLLVLRIGSSPVAFVWWDRDPIPAGMGFAGYCLGMQHCWDSQSRPSGRGAATTTHATLAAVCSWQLGFLFVVGGLERARLVEWRCCESWL